MTDPRQDMMMLEHHRHQPSSCKKRKTNPNDNLLNDPKSDLKQNEEIDVSMAKGQQQQQVKDDWEKLYKELQIERVTKAESLLQSYVRESEEREKLMRSYNQELETENQVLRNKVSDQPDQLQQLQELQNLVRDLRTRVANQKATIQAYQKLTGTTIQVHHHHRHDDDDINTSNNGITTTTNNNNNNKQSSSSSLDCDCTVENTETKMKTKFRITTVSVGKSNKSTTGDDDDDENIDDNCNDETILKYRPLENPSPLPEFLHEDIEFESSQLPPLLQNVLRGLFPEED